MENYLDYLNESPTVFFKCRNDSVWTVEFITDNIKEIFGYSPQEFINGNLNFIDLVYKNDKNQLNNEIEYLLKISEQKYEFKPYRMVSKDKRIIWIQDITKILRDDKGKITYFYCYITDITNQIQLNKKLNISEDIISTIYNNSFQFIGLMKPDGTLIKANKTSLEFANIKESDVIGKKFWDCPWWQHSIKEQNILKKDIEKASNGEFIRTKKVHYDPNGNKIYVDFSIKPVFNNENEVIYLIPEGHNITDNVLKEKQIKRYLNIINENVLISTTDLDGRIIACSDKFIESSGFEKKELIGKRHNIMKHHSNDLSLYKNLWETIAEGKVWFGEYRNIRKNGEVYWVENIITPNYNSDDVIESYTSIYNDITLRKEISELLITDVLTNLYNRRHFNTVFKTELNRSRRNSYNFTLLILDIDYFKQYNDIYGHHEGDIALKKVSNALKKTLKRSEDYIFRLGGEEFCIITTNISQEGVFELSMQLKNSIENLKLNHVGNKVCEYLTISLGAKIVDEDSTLNYEEIYKEADKALYKAKEEGRNKVIISK